MRHWCSVSTLNNRNQLLVACATMLVLATVLLVIIVRWGGSGTEAPNPSEVRELADAACPRVTSPFLYRVEKAGKTSYILGTRHAGVSLAKFPPAVDTLFRASKIAVFESIVTASPESPLATSIEDTLGPELWDRYREVVGDEIAERVNHESIGAANAALFLLYEDTNQAIDRELLQLADSLKIKAVGLEDAAKTKAIGDLVLGVDTLRAVVKAVHRRAEIAASTRHDLRRYCAGELDDGGRSYSESEARKLADSTRKRTRAWLPTLEALFDDGGAFVVVGNAHASGAGSLSDQLGDDGYTITRVPGTDR